MNRYAELNISSTNNDDLRNKGTKFQNTPKYPVVTKRENDIFVLSEWGDRFESLAFQFYGDITLWWIIAISNPNVVDFSSIYIPVGSQIRIPQDISPIIDSYNDLNR